MSQPEWDALAHDVQDLRTRVARMELALGLAPNPEAAVLPAAPVTEPHPLETSAALLPIVGRTLLGLAGAYLLRALTESGTFSPRMGVAVGVCYAMGWLVWAARTPAARRLETALLGLTSVLVVSPLLYEATSHFHAISTWTAAALLFAFTVFGFAVSWRKDLLIVATFATLAGLGTSAALLFATHDVLPFTYLFLAIAAAVEISACLDHWLSERWLTAAAADLAVLLATWLVTNERGLPDTYAPISHSALLGAQVALLAIYLSSIIVRTLLRGFTFTAFETTQCALAFVISVGGGLQLTAHNPRVAPAFAILAIACGVACYLVSFLMLDRADTHTRNFYTYSTFALLLTVAGSRILLSGEAAAIAWGLLALTAIWVGGVFLRLSLKVHGCVFLVLALAGSSAIEQAAGLLLGNRTWPGGAPWAIWSGALTASLCYFLGTRQVASVVPSWSSRAWRILVGGTSILLVAGIGAGLLTSAYHAIFGAAATHAYCATLRTFVLSAAALLLAWSAVRWNDRPEFGRLIYPVMALGAYCMIGVDLRQDRTAALFLSLLFYGAALMLLPRVGRPGRPVHLLP
ncbi:MAG TPA: hypothetical protein VNX17_11910 [Edaphobacter sp.]|nr:hypothetical protein [Edaphobacter sp.]